MTDENPGNLLRRAPEAAEKFKSVFDQSPIATAILDRSLRYIHVNDAWTRTLGYELAELLGKAPADITHPDDRAEDAELVRRLASGETRAYSREKRYVRRDGTIVHVLLHAAAVHDAGGESSYFIGQILDITERVRDERAIRALQAELSRQAEISATILKNMPRGAVFLIDRDLRYVSAHGPSIPDLLHVSAEELPGRSAEMLIPEQHREEVLTHLRATLEGRETEFEAIRGSRTYEVRTAPIYSGESAPVAALIHLYDVTERKAQEGALARERERFRTLVANAPVGIFEIDANGDMLYTNDLWNALTGLTPDDARVPARRLAGVHPEDREKVLATWSKARADGSGYKMDFRFSSNGGQPKRLSSVAAPMRGADGEVTGFIGITSDVTAQANAADAVERSLREKETLLKEIHHRVKNNLQVIGSIIGLQANRAKDDGVRRVFDDVRSRIQAIALLHERLYKSPDLGAIDLGEYVTRVAVDAARTAGGGPDRTTVHVPSGPVALGIDEAVPVGLIVNELVTNAVKHGSRGAEKARVDVHLALDDRVVRLAVIDDGSGFAAGFEPTTTTLGMLLVKNLTHQLRGEVTFASAPTRVTLVFPIRMHGRPE